MILITRDIGNVQFFTSCLKECSLLSCSVPLIETCAIAIPKISVCEPLGNSGREVWVFSSPRGVEYLAKALTGESVSRSIQFVAQGDVTAKAVAEYFGTFDVTVSPFRTNEKMGEWLISEFPQSDVSFRVFGPRERSRACEETLQLNGRIVRAIAVYETRERMIKVTDRKIVESFYTEGIVTFFSPSAVKSWIVNKLELPYRTASFGPVTSESMQQYGIKVWFEAPSNSLHEFAYLLKEAISRQEKT